jgi:CO/xanthine dehydrogenase Mo-binding subunit
MEFATIHKSVRKIDGNDRVNANAVYGADIEYPRMLYAKGVYPEYIHAEIVSIDTSQAEKLDGVECVITAEDIPGSKIIGEDVEDQYVMAYKKTRYCGDVVAVVAATTPQIAQEAAKLVRVEYKRLPELTDTKTAEGNAVLVLDTNPNNIMTTTHTKKGSGEDGLKKADYVFEADYSTDYQEHMYLEPDVVVAIPGEREGEVTVKGSIQNLYMTRYSLKRCLNIPISKATVISAEVGGAFGGKQENIEAMAVRAALIAIKTKRPVKYVLSREESMKESFKRNPFDYHIKLGVNKDGKLVAICGSAVVDSGPYANMTPAVMFKSVSLGSGPYNVENTDFFAKAIATNNIYTGSFRGFGNPQSTFARELAINEVAEKLGISPYEFRKKNLLKTGDRNGTDQLMNFHEVGIGEVIDKVCAELDYEKKYYEYTNQPKNARYRKGVGFACSLRGNSIGKGVCDTGRATITVNIDGSIMLSCGLTELGQGLNTALSQIAAEALGVDFSRITMNYHDSSKCLETGAAIASRGTFMGGNAIIDAARSIKNIMSDALREKYNLTVNADIVFKNDMVAFDNREISFEEAVNATYSVGKTPSANGTFIIKNLPWDDNKDSGDAFYEYTYSCIGAEVMVDTYTGKVDIIKAVSAQDIGRAINPRMAEGQMYGGAVMARGYSLLENIAQQNGRPKNDNMDTYRIPTIMDTGEVVPIIVEHPDDRGPYGARSLGEPSFDPGAGAYINAVNNALGTKNKIRKIPVSMEDITERLMEDEM